MFYAHLSNRAHWQPFLHSPLFIRSLLWVSENAGSATNGIYELGEPGWFVNVHGYTTQPRELCAWENHPETIDLQYIIEGTEVIDVAPVESLGKPTEFKPESDSQKFAPTNGPATQLLLNAGDFVIFLPGEAHRPKVAAQEPVCLKKLVVKIPAKLLAGG